MALFRDDTDYTHRQSGFGRYKQILSFYAFHWVKINLMTVAGALPLVFGIALAVAASSLLILLPASLLGGMIFGPFYAGMVDAVMRGLRDAPGNWFANYKKSWRQNWKGSLLPGAVLGLFVGLYAFLVHIFESASVPPTPGTLVLLLVGACVLLGLHTLYWPQLVLFSQRGSIRIRNALLFAIRHSWKVLGAVVLQLAWILLMILFMPWTLTLVPFLGIWYILFLSQYLIYGDLNADLCIEEQFIPVEGDPWRKDSFEREGEESEEAEPDPYDSGVRRWESLLKDVEKSKEGSK